MVDYKCPECGGGFPDDDADEGCPWCGEAFEDGNGRRRMTRDLVGRARKSRSPSKPRGEISHDDLFDTVQPKPRTRPLSELLDGDGT